MTEQEILKYNYTNDGRNYVLLGNTRWIAFTRNVIENKLIPKFGRNFNLVVYWHNNSSDETVDYICVPYTKVSHLLTEEHLTGKGTKRERWTFIIKDNLLCVHANTKFSIDISPYINRTQGDNEELQIHSIGGKEGDVKYILHKTIERNPTLIKKVKGKRKLTDPGLHCEICGFSFIDKYGAIGEDFIEAHHKIPLSSLEKSTNTNERDIILICSNCHRMLHRISPVLDASELRARIDGNINKKKL